MTWRPTLSSTVVLAVVDDLPSHSSSSQRTEEPMFYADDALASKRAAEAYDVTAKDKKLEEPVHVSPVRRTRSGSHGPSAFVVGSSQMHGLRSRRSSAHRRVKGDEISHPLKTSSSLVTVAGSDDAITRPALRRWLSASEDGDGWYANTADGEDEVQDGEVGESDEVDVLVIEHKVAREDSLAGVALKYGIPLAELRKANQMWATDTIHFRKVLYIPLHAASKRYAELLLENRLLQDETAPSSSNAPSIKRVPPSQLAYFPSVNKLSTPSDSTETIRALNGDGDSPRPFLPTISSRGLSAFIKAIPLPSSDSLMSRLSLDSNEARANSSRSETSSDQEHELLPMKPKDGASYSPQTKRRTPDAIHDRGDALMLLPVVQTEQMKPSPQMELPKSLRRTNS